MAGRCPFGVRFVNGKFALFDNWEEVYNPKCPRFRATSRHPVITQNRALNHYCSQIAALSQHVITKVSWRPYYTSHMREYMYTARQLPVDNAQFELCPRQV